MKIFIAGGTGVLGVRLVPQLVEKGYEVGVLSRSKENTTTIKQMGAEPIETSLFDPEDLSSKTENFNTFIHLATSIPEDIASATPEDWQMNEKLRIEGTENFIKASLNADCELYIQQSATFGYGHHGDSILNEEDKLTTPVPTAISIPEDYQQILDDIVKMEGLVNDAVENQNLPAIILRFGWFYSFDSKVIEDIDNGGMVRIFRTDPYISIINVDDAVKAVISALNEYEDNLGEIFNIVDDSDTFWRDFVEFGAQETGNRNPMIIPGFLVKLLYNSYALNFLKTSTRVSNAKAKKKLNWEPEFVNYKYGLEHEIKKYKSNRDVSLGKRS